MQRFPCYCLLSTAVLAITLLTVSLGQGLGNHAAAQRSLEEWDIPELADHLNHAGLEVRLRFADRNGVSAQTAYLTTTDKDWDDLNHLFIHPERIQEWRGTVCCKRARKEQEPVFGLQSDPCVVAGPFVFFGDDELLERIRVALTPFAPHELP